MNHKTSTAAALTALVLAGCSGGTTDTTVDPGLETPTTEFTATTGFTDTTMSTDTTLTTDTTITGDTSMDSSSSTLGGDAEISGLIADLQTGFAEFGQTLSASGVEGDLGEAWQEAQGTLAQTLSDVQAGGALDMDTAEQALDDFEAQLSGADEEVRAAWDDLRSALETAMAQIELSS